MNRAAAIAASEGVRAIDTEVLGRLVEHIYRGVEDRQGMRDFLAGCIAELGAFSASIVVFDRTGRVPRYIASHPHFGAAAASYVDRFEDDDPILAAILKAEPRRAYLVDELIDPLQKSTHRYFTEWAVRNDVGDVLTCRLPFGDTLEFMLGFLRSRSAPPFGEAERAIVDLLLPHMEQANELHRRLDRLGVFADIAQEQMFHSGQGLAVLDEDGRLVFTNPSACRILRDSETFRSDAGVLLPRDPALAARFVVLRQRCAGVVVEQQGTAPAALRLPQANGEALLVSVLPYRPGNPNGFFRQYAARVLLVISKDVPDTADTREQLRRVFDLTSVEADVFWRIGNGESVEEIAASSGQSAETVRTRLKRLFSKTGVRRQGDLVRLAMQGAPGWGNPGRVLQ